MCSEVAVDLYTTKILKADVTVFVCGVSDGAIRPDQCGILQRDTPETSGQGTLLSTGMAHGARLVNSSNNMVVVMLYHLGPEVGSKTLCLS